MRNEDASQSGMNQAIAPDARDDADHLAAADYGPALGNAITGVGTITGSTGTDMVDGGTGKIVAIEGAGGSDTSFADGKLEVEGQYGTLTIDADGNYSYVRNPGTPAGVADVFNYTLQTGAGASDTAKLIINIGDVPMLKSAGNQLVPGADGVVVLPAGVELSDIRVVGRDLVITLPDGTTMVIPDGAIFVPQLVIDGVEVPASNLAALLIGSEPKPAAGDLSPLQQSSGGNFAVPVAPLDPGVPLGDLLPPTELAYTPPDVEEIGQFVDKEPVAGTAAIQLDDDDVPGKGGNPGGPNDDVGSPNATGGGLLPGSDGDGSLSWALLSSGAPNGFSYNLQPDGSIQVVQVQDGNNVIVLTITVNSATGAYTVTENNPVRHAPEDTENNIIFVVTYAVTDDDGDVALGTLTIDVDDDTPTVTVVAGSDANVILTTDDAQTIGASSDTAVSLADFSGVFGATVISPGADGLGAGSSSSYSLNITGPVSGLSSHGSPINLFILNGVVVGTTGGQPASLADANIVFTVSVSNTGIVTLTQLQQIDHPIASDPTATGAPFADHIVSMADGLITLTRSETVVDKDGDSVSDSESVNIGANLRFTDDGPTLTEPTRLGEGVDLDETSAVDIDGFPISATSGSPIIAPGGVNYGADGQGPNPVFGFTLSNGGSSIASGLATAVGDQPITLYLVDSDTIEGRYGAGDLSVAFTLQMNANGTVTLTQEVPLEHLEDGGPAFHNDILSLTVTVNEQPVSLVNATVTYQDFDGDTVSASVAIGESIRFFDDGPDATPNGGFEPPVLVVDESPLPPNGDGDNSDTASFAGAFGSPDYGADGAGSVSYQLLLSSQGALSGLYALDATDVLGVGGDGDGIGQGAQILLYSIGGQIVGSTAANVGLVDATNTYFTISADGSGNVTLTRSSLNMWHDDTANHDDPEILTAALNTIRLQQTVTDADGDTDTATVDLSTGVFRFEDDGPSFVAGTVTSAVGEDTLPDGLIDAGDTKTTSTGAISLAGLVDFGTDGAGSLRFDASAIAALTAQNISSNGVLLKYAVSADGLTLTAYTGASAGTGTDVFTVTLSGTDATFVLLDQIDHTGANLSGSGDDQIKTIDLSGVIRIYDADGDSVALGANAFRVTVEDDIPDVTQASNINIQNSGDVAHTGIFVAKSGADNPSVTNDLFKSVTFSAVVNSTTVQTTTPLTQVSEDADKAVFSFSFSYNSGSGSTLATGTITFYKTDANGATPGTYTVDLDNPIAGLSIQSVQGGQAPVFHDLDLNGDGDTTDNGEDNLVAVVQVGSDFFIQFTGRTGVNAPTSDFGHDDLWGGGTRAEVKISSSAIGVFGNSVQDKDVLDYNFYSSDPGATLGAPTTSAGTAFVKITQFNPNGGEDFVITLKLADPATPGTFITRTIVVNSNDVLTTAPAGYPALSNGEGYIIIEPNDYIYLPAVPDNYEIVGIQLRSSTEGVQSTTGEVYNFNGNLGAFDSTTAVFGPTGGGDQGTNDNDVFKIIDIGVVRTSTVNQTATLTFNVTIGDADGDTDTQTVVATINSSPDSSTPIPVTPVVLDMDGDGVAFLPLAAGVMFNYGAGWVSTAWAGPNDAILLRDVNGNGLVDDASEFVFGGNGLTDMEALHAMYGEQLDASDADFTMFALWTDANSNGVVDSGEMQSLAEAGIVSIGLVSDGQSYVAANGDVFVAGSSTYTRTDGSTGEAADAAFATGLVARTQEVERIAANSNTTVLAAAVAAAGMAASSAAAAGTGTDSADSAMRTALYAIESVSMPDLSGSTSAQALATAIQDASATIAFPLGGATFDGPQWTGLIGDLGQVGGFDAAPSPFGQGTEMLAVQIALPSVMSDVGMPSAAQMATIDRGPVQTIDTVEMILVDALEGGGVNPIDTVLNGFVPEIGGIAVIDGAASGFQAGVSTWDMGSAGIFTPAVTNVITNEAMMLHHDAIQPAANG